MSVSFQYNGTDITVLNESFEGLPFFRKYIGTVEHRIYQILMEQPHPNVVKVYRLTDAFVDMEKLTPVNDLPYQEEYVISAAAAKDHLQRLGIFYMDWKSDNLGITDTGTYRLFDFDGSGIFRDEWLIEPQPYWSYRQALDKGLTDPKEMDDYAFELNLSGKK
jgi:hypothetical protein